MQAPETKPIVTIALKFCIARSLIFLTWIRFSAPEILLAKILLNYFLSNLNMNRYQKKTTNTWNYKCCTYKGHEKLFSILSWLKEKY